MRVDAQNLRERSSSIGVARFFRIDPFKTRIFAIYRSTRPNPFGSFHVLAELELDVIGISVCIRNARRLRRPQTHLQPGTNGKHGKPVCLSGVVSAFSDPHLIEACWGVPLEGAVCACDLRCFLLVVGCVPWPCIEPVRIICHIDGCLRSFHRIALKCLIDNTRWIEDHLGPKPVEPIPIDGASVIFSVGASIASALLRNLLAHALSVGGGHIVGILGLIQIVGSH